jgi:hypothetical protein
MWGIVTYAGCWSFLINDAEQGARCGGLHSRIPIRKFHCFNLLPRFDAFEKRAKAGQVM